MGFGKRGAQGSPASARGFGAARQSEHVGAGRPHAEFFDTIHREQRAQEEAQRLRLLVPILIVVAVFALPMAFTALLADFPVRHALGVSTVAVLPALWILAVIGFAEPHGPNAKLSRSQAFMAAHPFLAGIGGFVGFGWFVFEHEATLWEILVSSRHIFDVHGFGEQPLIATAVEEWSAGVGLGALLWFAIRRINGFAGRD